MRGGVGPGAMHWVLCIVWVSGAQRNPRAKEGRDRAGGTAQSALLGVDQSPVNHVQTRGGLPGSWSPHWCALPRPTSPTHCSCGRKMCRQVVVEQPHLLGGPGQSLYQIPLDLPPGGARIRAEARFGTWSSIWEPERLKLDS